MGIEKLIPWAVSMAMMAAASGQLPRVIRQVQIAQLQLLKEAQSSKWGRPFLPTAGSHGEANRKR
jgi:hypothetical protein